MMEILVIEQNVSNKSVIILNGVMIFTIPEIRIPGTGFPESGFLDLEWQIQIPFRIRN